MKNILILFLLFISVSLFSQNYETNYVTVYKRVYDNKDTEWEQQGFLLERNIFDVNDNGYLYWQRKGDKYRFKITEDNVLKNGARALEIKDTDGKHNVVFFQKYKISMPYNAGSGENMVLVFDIVDSY